MHYKITKNEQANEWLLLIHGLGGSLATWKYQLEDFSDYNIICVDLQGHGLSEFLKEERRLPQEAAAIHINEILEQEGIDEVSIVSLSLGTIVAFEFHMLFPEKVKSMVLAGCVLNLKLNSQFLLFIAELCKHLFPTKLLYPIFAKITMPKNNHKASRKIFVRESLKMSKEAFCSWVSVLRISQKRLLSYVTAMKVHKTPMLFISGEEDYLFKNGIETILNRFSDAHYEIIEKCGHVCSIEKHQLFNEKVLEFLKDLHPIKVTVRS